MKIKFYGVRGSIPVPGKDTVKYGGNTTCVEVEINDRIIVFDAGSGIRPLGLELAKRSHMKIHLFLSHVHWDHIQGFPFFIPALKPGNDIHIYGTDNADSSLGEILAGQMEGPHFPLSITQMGSSICFHDVKEGATIQIKEGDIVLATVQNARLNHPNGVVGYRLTEKSTGKTFVLATDTEHYEDKMDENLLRISKGADLLIYDGQYTSDEYNGECGNTCHKSWGHSTWKKGLEIAKKAGVKKLIITHHDPLHNDKFIDKMADEAIKYAAKNGAKGIKIEWAYEGMVVKFK